MAGKMKLIKQIFLYLRHPIKNLRWEKMLKEIERHLDKEQKKQ